MGADTPGRPGDGEGPEPPDGRERPDRPRWWDRSSGESALAVETRQPFGSRAAHRAELEAAAANAANRRREPHVDGGADGTADRTSADAPDRMAERIAALREIVTDEHGNYIGVEGRRKDVRVISVDQMNAVAEELHRQFGEPELTGEDPKGAYEGWWISREKPRSSVTIRTFSKSYGAAVDLNNVPGFEDLTRFHLPRANGLDS